MSDHDRGAYTPHHDAPLSFDARQTGGRRAFPTTLIISLVILLGLGGAIFMFYRSGVRGAGEVPTPVGSPVAQIKAPAPAGQAQPEGDAASGLQIYKSESPTAAGAPVFAAGPEQPQPRPAPVIAQPVAAAPIHAVPAPAPITPPPVAAPVAAQVAASGATTKAAPAPAPVPAKPVVVAKAKPDEIDSLLKAKPATAPAKPVQVADAKPAPTPVKTAPAPAKPVAQGAAVVQIGAFSSAALAGKGWSDMAAAYPAALAGKGKLVESVDHDGKTLFRGAVSGFASHADAVAFCMKLKADGKACIVR